MCRFFLIYRVTRVVLDKLVEGRHNYQDVLKSSRVSPGLSVYQALDLFGDAIGFAASHRFYGQLCKVFTEEGATSCYAGVGLQPSFASGFCLRVLRYR